MSQFLRLTHIYLSFTIQSVLLFGPVWAVDCKNVIKESRYHLAKEAIKTGFGVELGAFKVLDVFRSHLAEFRMSEDWYDSTTNIWLMENLEPRQKYVLEKQHNQFVVKKGKLPFSGYEIVELPREIVSSLYSMAEIQHGLIETSLNLPPSKKLIINSIVFQTTTKTSNKVLTNSRYHVDALYLSQTMFFPKNSTETEGGTHALVRSRIGRKAELVAKANHSLLFAGGLNQGFNYVLHRGPSVRPEGIFIQIGYDIR
jgi:hypothetical protein